jgi:TonB-dependent SusC/RagA subfamily outer membrane receptor
MDILENLVVDQNDVESITVLKDAQAAIYGTTGANGILITTKSGKKNSKSKIVTIHIPVFRIQELYQCLMLLNMPYY